MDFTFIVIAQFPLTSFGVVRISIESSYPRLQIPQHSKNHGGSPGAANRKSSRMGFPSTLTSAQYQVTALLSAIPLPPVISHCSTDQSFDAAIF